VRAASLGCFRPTIFIRFSCRSNEAAQGVEHDLLLLVEGIRRLGVERDGEYSLTFGAIFKDEILEQQLESLVLIPCITKPFKHVLTAYCACHVHLRSAASGRRRSAASSPSRGRCSCKAVRASRALSHAKRSSRGSRFILTAFRPSQHTTTWSSPSSSPAEERPGPSHDQLGAL